MGTPTYLVTGANAGLGQALALGLAKHPVRVVLVCRNHERGLAAQHAIQQQSGNQSIDLIVADLANQADIRRAAAEIIQQYPVIHGLINNAGIQLLRRQTSVDGFELTFATNHLGPFLLTNLLLPALQAAKPGRVITVSSMVHRWGQIRFDDLQAAQHYNSNQAYNQSKLANLLFSNELARRYPLSQLVSHCFEPGLMRTNFTQSWHGWYRLMSQLMLGLFGQSPEQAAATGVMLALEPAYGQTTGGYFYQQRPQSMSAAAQNRELAQRLWQISSQLTGLDA